MAYDQLMQTYLGVGLLADRPVAPNVKPGVAAFYYGTDSAALYVWYGSGWHTLAGGATALAEDTDVAIASPTDAQVLTYVAADGKWENRAAAGGGAGPSGELGYVEPGANLVTSSASLVDWSGASVTVTVGSRPVLITLLSPLVTNSGASGNRTSLGIYDVTANVLLREMWAGGGGTYQGIICQHRHAPAAGSRTYKAQGGHNLDGGSTTFMPGFLLVQEI